MVLPVLLAVTVGLVWLLAVGTAQVRVTDAAREAARALARGDSDEVARGLAEQVAPPGSAVSVARSEGQVSVTVTGRVEGPGGLWSGLPGAEVAATATALDEETG
jgi:Flp pilus assembly protein TadG